MSLSNFRTISELAIFGPILIGNYDGFIPSYDYFRLLFRICSPGTGNGIQLLFFFFSCFLSRFSQSFIVCGNPSRISAHSVRNVSVCVVNPNRSVLHIFYYTSLSADNSFDFDFTIGFLTNRRGIYQFFESSSQWDLVSLLDLLKYISIRQYFHHKTILKTQRKISGWFNGCTSQISFVCLLLLSLSFFFL